MIDLNKIAERFHFRNAARGVVVMDRDDWLALLDEITQLRERVRDLEQTTGRGPRTKTEREELVGQYFRARDSRRMIRVVDTLGSDSFLAAFHHPDGRKMYSNEELTYEELAKQYDLDHPVSPGANR